jgi:hypothetical protein
MSAPTHPRIGNGAGYGGPAKGAGTGGPAVPFTADSPTRGPGAHLENGDPDEQAYRQQRQREKRALRQKMMAVLEEIASSGDQPGSTRAMAADKVLDRLDGKPKQQTELTGADGGAIVTEVIYRWDDAPQE